VITYSATLDVPTDTATLLTDLLIAERRRRGTGIGARAATCRTQAILVLRWFRDTGMPTLARDAGVSPATGYRYLHEGIDVLAARAPDLHSVLEQGKAAGWSHVVLDGTLIATDRCRTTNPDTGHDLWYSGEHRAHGGNVQVLCDPEGFPVAVSDAQPGSMHDIAAARATGFLDAVHAAAALLGLPALADKGYHGAGIGVHTPAKGARLAPSTATRNQLLTRLRAEDERGIALLKTRWKALRHVRLCPQRIGAIAAAALVLTPPTDQSVENTSVPAAVRRSHHVAGVTG
jgi:DDE superfamily endonuclease